MIIPRHIQIEPVNGMCTSRCIMCTIRNWTREPNIMDTDSFRQIMEKFRPYRDRIEYVTLHGCGEPLIDKRLPEKIRIAKEMGFKGLGFATNCTLLTEEKSRQLIESGLDTIICSIDGTEKQTHESIRVGTNFEQVVANVKNFIKIRSETGNTRVLVRFIRQEKNKDQWEPFLKQWSQIIDESFGDKVVKFDVHNWGGNLEKYQDKDPNRQIGLERYVCEEVFERMSIFSNGEIALCNADDNLFFRIANALEDDPVEVYNGPVFERYREMMKQGRIDELKYCGECTIPRSRQLKSKTSGKVQ